jgi:23S rRNA (guanosine2251-2'-O)-methyltransferase
MTRRRDPGTERRGDTIYGANAVREVLRAGRRRVGEVMVVRDREGRHEQTLSLAREAGVRVTAVEPRRMAERFAGRQDQGIAARVAPYPYVTMDELLDGAVRPLFVVALDEVQDPHNLGAVIRSAVALGAGGVVIHRDRCARVTAAAVKASAGMTEHARVARVTNLARALERVRRASAWVLGLTRDAPRTIYEQDLRDDVAIVLGGEGRGLRRLTRKRCDALLSIPLDPRCDSLNVASAAAVALAEAARQRGGRP